MNQDKGWRCAHCKEHRPHQRPNIFPWGVTYCLDCGRTRASELAPDAEYDSYIERRLAFAGSVNQDEPPLETDEDLKNFRVFTRDEFGELIGRDAR